jgi:hypothetical protein
MKQIRDKYDYVGWVPCISGHLFFEYSGCGLSNNERDIYADINHIEFDSDTKENHRYILVSSGVNWKDKETHLDGRYRVILLASMSIEADQLDGQVYIIPYKNKVWESSGIKEKLLGIKSLTLAGDDIKKSFLDLKNKLDDIPADKIFITNFKVIRSGFTFLRYNNKDNQTNSETSFVIARQAYYYVKYTFHNHVHHHKSAESLTTTHPLPDEDAAIGMMISNDLKRSLVVMKRNLRASAYIQLPQVKGIVSYAKSLLESCKKEGFMSTNDYETEKSYIENIGESLEVSKKILENRLAAEEKTASDFRSVVLFLLAVIAPITLIFRDEIRGITLPNEPTSLLKVISTVAQNGYLFLGLGVLAFIGYQAYRAFVMKYGSSSLALVLASSRLRELIESIVFSKRRAAIVIFILLALGLYVFYKILMKL